MGNSEQKKSVEEAHKSIKALADGDELSIEWAVEHLRDGNCYEGWEDDLRYLLYRYEESLAAEKGTELSDDQWARIWESSPSKSIEHILPQSQGKDERTSEGIFVHRLGNLMLLPPGMNSKLQDKPVSEKISEYKGTGLYVASEVCEMFGKGEDWTRKKVEEREQKILEWVGSHWIEK